MRKKKKQRGSNNNKEPGNNNKTMGEINMKGKGAILGGSVFFLPADAKSSRQVKYPARG